MFGQSDSHKHTWTLHIRRQRHIHIHMGDLLLYQAKHVSPPSIFAAASIAQRELRLSVWVFVWVFRSLYLRSLFECLVFSECVFVCFRMCGLGLGLHRIVAKRSIHLRNWVTTWSWHLKRLILVCAGNHISASN